MKRDIYPDLLKWKKSERRKPLILRGARQTGKTYILKEFGKNEYEKYAYFDFEENPDLDDIFKGRLNPEKLIKNLSLLQGWEIKKQIHLIILDEIQASNNALNALKYFQEKAGEYHIIAAGSLLGVKLSGAKSFPVGKVNFLDIYPMTFLEFLDATGNNSLRQMIDQTKQFKPFALPLHNELVNLLREYFFIGGMPEPVKHYCDSKSLDEVRQIQKEIMDSYVLDFSKHADHTEIPKITMIWDSVPSQLAKENKKFMFTAIKKSARAREYENALQWLADAGLVMKSYLVSNVKIPLKGNMDREIFKVFLLDTGILGAMTGISSELIIKGDKLFNEYKGAFVENYVAQQLRAFRGMDLYYWKSEGQKAELDFLCEHDGKIYPLEAKAGINPRSKSLKSFDNQYSPKHLCRTTLLNLKRDGKICNYPLYAISLFPELIKTQ